jgi:HEAT repeats
MRFTRNVLIPIGVRSIMTRILALTLFVCSVDWRVGAQTPRTGDINFYGLHKVTAAEILQATGIKTGGPLPPSRGDLEDKIAQISGVADARVTAVCCQGDRAALFIGIEERGAPHAAFRSEPSGEASLPQDLLDRYQQFLTAVGRAAARGNTAEDLSAGHSMMDDPAARAIQAGFVEFATTHLDALRGALHNGSDPDTRAAAAAIIGYGPKTQAVVDDLQFALDDPEPAVRANAIRALSAFIVYAQKNPGSGLKIQPTWFVELLHSVELSDRQESSKALERLTQPGQKAAIRNAALDLVRERALPDLAEMARWPTLRYALPPFLLMGRIAGLPDSETQSRWSKGDREPVIEKALKTGGAKSKQPPK